MNGEREMDTKKSTQGGNLSVSGVYVKCIM